MIALFSYSSDFKLYSRRVVLVSNLPVNMTKLVKTTTFTNPNLKTGNIDDNRKIKTTFLTTAYRQLVS